MSVPVMAHIEDGVNCREALVVELAEIVGLQTLDVALTASRPLSVAVLARQALTVAHQAGDHDLIDHIQTIAKAHL